MNQNQKPGLRSHEIQIRVRYQETDAQGRLHHANFINYFEVGRIELLRAAGFNYRELEELGVFLVVTEVRCQYYQAARYDDLLTIRTSVDWGKGVRVQHSYRVSRGSDLLAEGTTVVASIDSTGKVIRLPKWLRTD